jgi:hypothetical protein
VGRIARKMPDDVRGDRYLVVVEGADGRGYYASVRAAAAARLREGGIVAVTPGRGRGEARGERPLRFEPLEDVAQAQERRDASWLDKLHAEGLGRSGFGADVRAALEARRRERERRGRGGPER